MLHTINKSPFLHRNLESCLKFAKKGDPILLYEDGVYAALPGTQLEAFMLEVTEERPVYAIQADLKARGITNVIEGVTVTDYSGFVELVEQHKVISWL